MASKFNVSFVSRVYRTSSSGIALLRPLFILCAMVILGIEVEQIFHLAHSSSSSGKFVSVCSVHMIKIGGVQAAMLLRSRAASSMSRCISPSSSRYT